MTFTNQWDGESKNVKFPQCTAWVGEVTIISLLQKEIKGYIKTVDSYLRLVNVFKKSEKSFKVVEEHANRKRGLAPEDDILYVAKNDASAACIMVAQPCLPLGLG